MWTQSHVSRRNFWKDSRLAVGLMAAARSPLPGDPPTWGYREMGRRKEWGGVLLGYEVHGSPCPEM